MAAKNYLPRVVEDTSAATAGAATTADASITCTADRRWDITRISVEASVGTGNEVVIYVDKSATEYKVWPVDEAALVDVPVTPLIIDFLTAYINGLQMEAGDDLIARIEQTDGTTKTVTLRAPITERDL